MRTEGGSKNEGLNCGAAVRLVLLVSHVLSMTAHRISSNHGLQELRTRVRITMVQRAAVLPVEAAITRSHA